jgi:hypothetical protein
MYYTDAILKCIILTMLLNTQIQESLTFLVNMTFFFHRSYPGIFLTK